MQNGIKKLRGKYALAAGERVIARAGDMGKRPKTSSAPDYIVENFPKGVIAAQDAQDKLAVDGAAVETLEAQLDEKVRAARDKERTLDSSFAAVRDRLIPEIKLGNRDALWLNGRLFPNGSADLSKVQGYPQVPVYKQWLVGSESEEVTSNPAYAVIAGQVGTFKTQLAAFDETLREKDALADALTAARESRDVSQTSWTDAFEDLLSAGARIHGADSKAFEIWTRPISEWKAKQDADRTRRAKAKATPAEPPAPVEPAAEVVEVKESDDG